MSADPHPVPTAPGPIEATVRPPGSKSETIRALAIAALADGRSHLYGPLSAEDPMAMVDTLRALGIGVDPGLEPWAVDGKDGRLTPPDDVIDVRESGLTARIALALAASADGMTRITGRGRLPLRPMTGLLEALAVLGVESRGDLLPIEVTGRGRLWGGNISVDCSTTSQFATALMVVAPTMREPCTLEIRGLAGSRGYLDVTASMMRRFGAGIDPTFTGYEIGNGGYTPSDVIIEPDASAATYPLAVAAVTGGRVTIEGLGSETRQPDIMVARMLERMGCAVDWGDVELTLDATDHGLKSIDADMSAAPDGALTLAVACLFADGVSRLSGLGSLRHKESDRLESLRSEIAAIGGRVTVEGDVMTIHPGGLRGGIVDPHGDHRIAMAMAVAGTRIPGVVVSTPDVVDKTWPGFWSVIDDLCR